MTKLHFTVLTLFPELIDNNVQSSITGRALRSGLFSYESINIRDFANNKYGKIDDTLYGGGTGMLMQPEPVYAAWSSAKEAANERQPNQPARTIYLSPKGRVMNQGLINELAQEDELILLCGHYEGIDDRVLQEIGAEEVSLGDFVITGGELAASILIDAVSRQIKDVLPNEDAFTDESHYDGRLENRQYTKPELWRDRQVPPVLLSGHHKKIDRWRYLDSLAETYKKRADLFNELSLSDDEIKEMLDFIQANYEL